jgi:hypothetical protein
VTRPEELDARGRRLRAALAAVLVRGNAPELRLVREWLDSWSGIGLIIAGVTLQGWDVQLTAYAARPPALHLLAAEGEGVPHAFEESLGVDGFLQEVEGLGLHGADAGGHAAHARDEDDRDRLLPGAELCLEVEAAAPVPEVEVEHETGRLVQQGMLEEGLGRRKSLGGKICRVEKPAQRSAQ